VDKLEDTAVADS